LPGLLEKCGIDGGEVRLEEDEQEAEDALAWEASARLDVLVVIDVEVAEIVRDLALR
jgi:hypothetical protein